MKDQMICDRGPEHNRWYMVEPLLTVPTHSARFWILTSPYENNHQKMTIFDHFSGQVQFIWLLNHFLGRVRHVQVAF